ncbi:MAG: AmmeMemoRadiSam system protein B [Candidatus Woesearchaeota archaeon]
MTQNIRRSVAAGLFYEEDPNALKKQIVECFESKRGPGDLPVNKRKGFIQGAIIPHAGYIYSGPCAAWAYKELAEAEMPDLYIIIGPNHTGLGGSALTTNAFETPFGIVRCDKSFATELLKKGSIVESELPHLEEHSIEVQLPFLQFINEERINELKILPIVLSHDFNYKKLALDIKETIVETKKRVTIIASSDFTHYGHNYGYLPFTTDVEKRIYQLDKKAINFIRKYDDVGFLNYVYETGATICGAIPIATLIKSVKENKTELLQYYTSGDVMGSYRNSVSYASIIFR